MQLCELNRTFDIRNVTRRQMNLPMRFFIVNRTRTETRLMSCKFVKCNLRGVNAGWEPKEVLFPKQMLGNHQWYGGPLLQIAFGLSLSLASWFRCIWTEYWLIGRIHLLSGGAFGCTFIIFSRDNWLPKAFWVLSCLIRSWISFSSAFSTHSLSFFHFILRFWNQTLTCFSVSPSDRAISILRGLQRYLLKWNSFSNSTSCFVL